jgi:hypothetical protein
VVVCGVSCEEVGEEGLSEARACAEEEEEAAVEEDGDGVCECPEREGVEEGGVWGGGVGRGSQEGLREAGAGEERGEAVGGGSE